MKIVRYLSLSDAGLLFHPNAQSTFCMCTQYYYRQIEGASSDPLKDPDEGIARFERGGVMQGKESIEEINNLFLSCWSILDADDDLDWNFFEQEPDIAIISTVSKVDKFLKRKFNLETSCEYKKKNRYFPPTSNLIHGPVDYTKEKSLNFCIDDSIFVKNPEYQRQKEYRFVLRSGPIPQYQRIVFYTAFHNTPDTNEHFVKKIVFNPKFLKESLAQRTSMKIRDVLVGILAENLQDKTNEFEKLLKKFCKEIS